MIKYRKIKPDDAIVLRNLAKNCPPLDVHTHYTYWVVANYFGEYGFIVEDDGDPIGYIITVETKRCVFVWQIGLLKEYRGKGISTKLIQKITDIAFSKSLYVEVSIAEDNIPSYSAFSHFCKKNNYNMTKINDVDLKDYKEISNIPSLSTQKFLVQIEKENLYRIAKS